MGHRYVSNQFMISGRDHYENNHSTVEQSCISMVRAVATDPGPFAAPADHMVRGGVHSNSPWVSGGRSNEHHSSYVSMEVQCLPPPFSRPVDPYTCSATNGNMSLSPMGPLGRIHSSHYNVPGIDEFTAGSGGPYKRKNPGVSEVSSNRFYDVGSSSSSQMPIEKPAVDRLNLPPSRGSSLSIDGQDSIRNVRSRLRPELEPCVTRTHVPSHASHFYQPTSDCMNYSVPYHPVNLNADVISQEWYPICYPASSHGRTFPPDSNGLRHETSQFHGGGSSIDIEASNNDSFFRGNLVSSSQHPHVSHAQPTRDGHYYSQRVTPLYRNGPSYCNYTHVGSSSTNEIHFPFENYSSRYSRHSRLGGWGSGDRPRIADDRLQPIADVMDPHDEFGHETITVNESSFYHNSRKFSDQYQDMRLDIDDMSYEELLALEERIGIVSTGLSEDGISQCLREKIYYSMHQNHEEATCPICLEEYKDGEKVGRMEKCGHEYHVDCIKKWLVMKKLCPICKSECSTQ